MHTEDNFPTESDLTLANAPTVAKSIKVWRFQDAPQEYRNLSPHGGDEDWLALVPAELADCYIGWMEPGSQFGCCDVSEHRLLDGSVVRIGAHA